MEMNVQARTSVAQKKLTGLLSLLMKGLLSNADEIFVELDTNKDNKVSKREFCQGFSESLGFVLDFSRIAKFLIQDRIRRENTTSLRRSGSLADIGSAPIFGAIVLGVLMTG